MTQATARPSRHDRTPARRVGGGQAILAARLAPELSHRTWSFPGMYGPARCDAFLVASGHVALVAAGDEPVALPGPCLLWLPPGVAGAVRLAAGSEGVMASIDAALVWRTVAEMPVAPQLRPLLEHVAIVPPERVAAHLSDLGASLGALVRESHDPRPAGAALMALHLGIVLLMLWRCIGGGGAAPMVRGGGASTVQRFRQLVEWHYRENLDIDRFARRLGVSRAHLHDACLRFAGRTPLALLHARLCEEAQARLAQTDLSVEQIGYSLGFRDPAYFNRFFKRLAGQSPGAWRQAAHGARPPSQTNSFAAWP
jgi:AraC-like DNA-binding protein